MRYCCRCTILAAVGTCYSLTHSNPTMKGSSKRPSRVHSCSIFSVFTVATPKAHQYPFGSLKYPLLRQVMPRIQGASGWSQWGASPTCPPSSSPEPPVQAIPSIPLSLQRSGWVLCPYTLLAPVYTVHLCLPKPYTVRV